MRRLVLDSPPPPTSHVGHSPLHEAFSARGVIRRQRQGLKPRRTPHLYAMDEHFAHLERICDEAIEHYRPKRARYLEHDGEHDEL